ncbi:HRD3-involved in degradation of Hmg2p [Pyrenophora seminiperda CCB06]|uniref:HRD3-involved in degradation of Hmg2p n=1 Tax=Pyrenophora seminiperda CCB06 TaxID=1302712 RepID=A0A3M7LZ27_9PLEO|nr:HRD3-involved in degradation of Hmg2p [Pyrenophora seminiperda CCB06]
MIFLSLVLCLSPPVHAEHESDYAHQKPLGGGQASGSRGSSSQGRESWKSRWGDADGDVNSHQGVLAFDEAMALLHQIKPATAPWWNFENKSGILGTSAYYAKEVFFLLFMNGPPQQELLTTNPQPKKLGQSLSHAVTLLEEAAAQKNADALFTLAEMNFYGNYTHPRNYSEAFRRYHELATLNGNASAQHMVGFMYATGIGGAAKQDQAKAMLYYTLGAEGGDVRSEMAVAYRHSAGISTPRNCEEAVYFYKEAAKKAIAYLRSGPPGGHSMPRESYNIADDEGGVYGEGASASSSGPNAKVASIQSDAFSSLDDVFEYMDLQARKGDARATFNLAKLNYDGARTLKRDLPAAKKRFLELARMYWTPGGKIYADVGPTTEKLAAKAAGYLGRMFMRGEGMPQSFEIAKTWFRRGIELGDALSQYSMGIMYLKGLGVPEDAVKAAELFAAAADQDLAVAQVRLGALFLDQGDIAIAIKYFELAARHGHLEAFYFLAEMTHNGVGRDKSCPVAAAYYKLVAEKAELVSTSFPEANEAYTNGNLETALVSYMMAAEQGFEVGQANVAYLLDQDKPRFTLNSLLPSTKQKASLASDARLALIYWTRSAEQKNVDSMVKMGDYYLMGLGTSPDQEKAAACYQAAAETMRSAQAMWNLGWMHENGIGIDQDFHLAKRHYDMALETNPREAYLPVVLALYKLRFRSWWNTFTNGNIKSIEEEPVLKEKWTFFEWVNAFLEAELAVWDDYEPDDYDDAARGDYYGDGYHGDDIDSDILESLIILALSGALAFLLYYRTQRQRRQEEERRRQQEQQQQLNNQGIPMPQPQPQPQPQVQRQQDRGLFPNPDDPEFMNWVAGGVGH